MLTLLEELSYEGIKYQEQHNEYFLITPVEDLCHAL